MNMIGHNDISINKMSFAFQYIKPVVDNIIAVQFFNLRQPLIASKSDKKCAKRIRNSLFCWNGIKVQPYAIVQATSLLMHKARQGDVAGKKVFFRFVCQEPRRKPHICQ